MKLILIAGLSALLAGLLLAYLALPLPQAPTASDQIWRCQSDLHC